MVVIGAAVVALLALLLLGVALLLRGSGEGGGEDGGKKGEPAYIKDEQWALREHQAKYGVPANSPRYNQKPGSAAYGYNGYGQRSGVNGKGGYGGYAAGAVPRGHGQHGKGKGKRGKGGAYAYANANANEKRYGYGYGGGGQAQAQDVTRGYEEQCHDQYQNQVQYQEAEKCAGTTQGQGQEFTQEYVEHELLSATEREAPEYSVAMPASSTQ